MNAEIADLRRQLDEYQLPAKFEEEHHTNGAATETSALLAKYKQARDEYLQRKMMHAVLHQATTTYDAETGRFALPQVPTQEEQEALAERRLQVLQTVTEKAEAVQRKILELQAKHSHFQQRRDEFEQLVLLQEKKEEDDDDALEEEDMTLDESEIAVQEERLAELQTRRAALQVQLRTVQQQNFKIAKAVEQRKAKLEGLQPPLDGKENATPAADVSINLDPMELESLKQKNAELQCKLDKVTEIQSFYANLRLLMEELSGIRILSVNSEGSASDMLLLLTVQLLHKYDVEIVLKMTDTKKKDFTIQSAKFVSNNSLVTGPALGDADDDEHGSAVVQLRIPSLDDLVQLAGTAATVDRPGENLRFFLRESLARITMVEERVLELTVLQQQPGVVTKIGKFFDNESSASPSNDDQEVVCSLNYAQMVAILRLTPDCPMVPGTVYVDQLVGLGGWDPVLVERIRGTVNHTNAAGTATSQKFRSPVAVLHAIQDEIQRLQDEEGVQLPLTPKLPLRGHEW